MQRTIEWRVFLLSFLLLTGCDFNSLELDKVKGPSLNPSFKVNLGNIKYSVSELVESLEDASLKIEEGEDLSLSFVYRDTSRFEDINEFIVIDDITNTERYAPFSADLPAIPSDQVVTLPTKTFEFEFTPRENEQVDSTFFKAGTLSYVLSSDFGIQIDYVFTLNDVRSVATDEPVVFSSTLTASQIEDGQSISLVGLKNISERIGTSNVFRVSLDMTFTIPAGTAINSGDQIQMDLLFSNTEFSAIFGDFGSEPVEVQKDSITIEAFDEFGETGLLLRNPSISMEFENKFGIELGISLDEIQGVNQDGSEIALAGSVVDNPQFIDAPDITELGATVASSFSINIDNSNIDDLLNSTPEKLVFGVSASPNPVGSDNLTNFLFDSSYLEIRTTVEIPLDFNMNGFSKSFDLSVSGSDLESADSIILNVQVLNEIPFNGTLDLTFKDNAENVLYTMETVSVIESPAIGADGRTVGAQESKVSIKLSNEALDAFLSTDKITALVNIFTFEHTSGNYVKIYSDYQLEIYLTAEGSVELGL